MVWAFLMNLLLILPDKDVDSINWRNRRILTWTDFKGSPVSTAPNAALTSTSILINYQYNDDSFQFNLNCVFYPHKSWTKVKSGNILAHEQGHFDISQLYTRKLFKALKEYKFRPATVDRDVQEIYQRITNEQADYQKLYDTETNYSRNAAGQEEWVKRIEQELKETADYAKYPER